MENKRAFQPDRRSHRHHRIHRQLDERLTFRCATQRIIIGQKETKTDADEGKSPAVIKKGTEMKWRGG